MDNLSSPEHHGHLDLVALVQEPPHLAGLGVEIARADLWPVLHLLDADVACLAPRLLGPLCRIKFELPIVHDPADRGIRQGRHLHQVKILLLGNGERLW